LDFYIFLGNYSGKLRRIKG